MNMPVLTREELGNRLRIQKRSKLGQPADAIPIIVYHRIDNSEARYGTTVSLFAAEMQYLHDNDFHIISMTDLIYDNTTNSFYLNNR
jgi:hypothetical protein